MQPAEPGDKDRFGKTLNRLVDDIYIPISAGGGIASLDDAKFLFDNGADKLVLNTAIFNNTGLINDIVKYDKAKRSEASVDYKAESSVYIKNGTEDIGISLSEYIKHIGSRRW